jgi:dolichol-phosphate mannosyltransferase
MGHHTPSMPGALICLPTYNERENLAAMVDAIDQVRAHVEGLEVLVIDDSSPDGTGELADRLATSRPWLHVLHRSAKEGLGRAYLAGFAWALARPYDRVLEMDCDFSHDPGRVPALIGATMSGGADLALGSRYTAGGGVRNWGLVRRFISAGGCLYARLFLSLSVRDLTGGFKCFRREVLEAIDLTTVRSEGYSFQIEMTYRTVLLGYRVREVPITFTDRIAGGSKMSRRIVLEAAWRVPQLRWRALRREIPRTA